MGDAIGALFVAVSADAAGYEQDLRRISAANRGAEAQLKAGFDSAGKQAAASMERGERAAQQATRGIQTSFSAAGAAVRAFGDVAGGQIASVAGAFASLSSGVGVAGVAVLTLASVYGAVTAAMKAASHESDLLVESLRSQTKESDRLKAVQREIQAIRDRDSAAKIGALGSTPQIEAIRAEMEQARRLLAGIETVQANLKLRTGGAPRSGGFLGLDLSGDRAAFDETVVRQAELVARLGNLDRDLATAREEQQRQRAQKEKEAARKIQDANEETRRKAVQAEEARARAAEQAADRARVAYQRLQEEQQRRLSDELALRDEVNVILGDRAEVLATIDDLGKSGSEQELARLERQLDRLKTVGSLAPDPVGFVRRAAEIQLLEAQIQEVRARIAFDTKTAYEQTIDQWLAAEAEAGQERVREAAFVEERIADVERAGALGRLTGREQELEAIRQEFADLERELSDAGASLHQLERLRSERDRRLGAVPTGTTTFGEGFAKGIEDQLMTIGEAGASAAQIGGGSLNQMWTDFLSGAESGGDAFKKFARNFVLQTASMIAVQATLRAVMAFLFPAAAAPVIVATGSVGGAGAQAALAPKAAVTTALSGPGKAGMTVIVNEAPGTKANVRRDAASPERLIVDVVLRNLRRGGELDQELASRGAGRPGRAV